MRLAGLRISFDKRWSLFEADGPSDSGSLCPTGQLAMKFMAAGDPETLVGFWGFGGDIWGDRFKIWPHLRGRTRRNWFGGCHQPRR